MALCDGAILATAATAVRAHSRGSWSSLPAQLIAAPAAPGSTLTVAAPGPAVAHSSPARRRAPPRAGRAPPDRDGPSRSRPSRACRTRRRGRRTAWQGWAERGEGVRVPAGPAGRPGRAGSPARPGSSARARDGPQGRGVGHPGRGGAGDRRPGAGARRGPWPSASSFGSGQVRSRGARAEVGGVGAVGGVDERVAVGRERDGGGRAALGARVLGVDGLEQAARGVDVVLDGLPVRGVAAGADDAAVLVLVGVEEPVLEPAARRRRRRGPRGRRRPGRGPRSARWARGPPPR